MSTSRSPWGHMVLDNLGYKLISLGLSILLWLYVYTERNPMGSRQLRKSLQTKNLKEKLTVLSYSPDQTAVTVDGPQWVLNHFDEGAVETYIDCAGLGPGEHRAPIRYNLDPNLQGFVTVQLRDRVARIDVDQETSKNIEVEPQFLTTPAPGYAAGHPVINPLRATVSGIGKDVSKVVRLVASLSTGTPPTSDIDKKVRLTPLDDNGNEVSGVKVTPDYVQVKVPIKELPVARMVFVTPDIQGNPQPPLRIEAVTVEPSRITLNGSPKALQQITVVTTEPIEVASATETFSKEVALKPLPGAITMDKERVRVTVKIAK